MSTTVLSASRAGLGSVIVTDFFTAIPVSIISDIGVVDPKFIKQPGIAAMDGVAQMAAEGGAFAVGVALMDGQAEFGSP